MDGLLRWIWRLYPRSFRARFGRELEGYLEQRRGEGRGPGAAVLVDAVVTLVRAWGAVILRQLTPGELMMDVELALRTLRRAPGYAVSVVAILSLALGANTAIFSVTHAVLLRALPYGTPERVYAIRPTPVTIRDDAFVVHPDFTALPHVEAAALHVDGGGANLGLDGRTVRVTLAQVTDRLFDVLDVPPLLGRSFGAGEVDAAVLSYDLWVRAFEADRSILGRRILLSGRPFTVVGVMPDGVAFPSPVDLWLPFPTDFEFYSNAIAPQAVARLRPDASADGLREILEERAAAEFAKHDPPPGYHRPPASVASLREELTGSVRTPLLVLMGIAGLVVFLGCLNLTGLVVSRTTRRMGALSIRRALGASRARLFTQLLAEVLILSLVAGLVGLGAASLASGLLTGMLPAETPGLSEVQLGAPVLLFAGAIAILAGIVVGMLPSLQGAWADERPQVARTATEGRKGVRTQSALVIGQVAVACVLVVAAGLMGRSLRNLEGVPLGYDLENVLTFRVQLPSEAYPDIDSRKAYLDNLERALRDVPGVGAVGATSFLPLQQVMGIGISLVAEGADPGRAPTGTWVQVTAGYFDAIGMEVVQGAPFAEPGSSQWDHVAITEALASAAFPDVAAVAGARAGLMTQPETTTPSTVDAVVRDFRLRGQQASPSTTIFTAMEASPPAAMAFAVRAQGSPTLLVDRVRDVARAVDPSVPPFDLTTTGQAAVREIATERAVTILSRLFSASALVLAALGLYGLVSQGLERRQRELGIRLVMGAAPRALVRSALVRPLALALVGLLAGVAVALWAATWLTPLLFGVAPRDPLTLVSVVGGVLIVTALAAYVPARRITRIDPTESLRTE